MYSVRSLFLALLIISFFPAFAYHTFLMKNKLVMKGDIIEEYPNKYLIKDLFGKRMMINKWKIVNVDLDKPKSRLSHLFYLSLGGYFPTGVLSKYVKIGPSFRLNYALDGYKILKYKIFINPYIGYTILSPNEVVVKFSILNIGIRTGYEFEINEISSVIPFLGISLWMSNVETNTGKESFRNINTEIGAYYRYYLNDKFFLGGEFDLALLKDRGHMLLGINFGAIAGYKLVVK